MKITLSVLMFVVVVGLSACSDRKNISPFPSIDAQTQYILDAKVNCVTGRRDILILEKEHASVGTQILAGVRSVFPIAVVGGVITGDYSDRFKVATGQYNEDLQTKINEIKSTCGIQ